MLGRRRALLERVASFALVALTCGMGVSIYLALKPLPATPTQLKGTERDSPSGLSALSEQQLQAIWQGRDPQQPVPKLPNVRDLVKSESADALPFRLRGIIYATEGISVAFIEAGGKVALYGTDATVEGWTVSAIEINAVTVTREGVERTLTIHHSYAGRPMATSSALARGAHRENDAGRNAAPTSLARENQSKRAGARVALSQGSDNPRQQLPPPLRGAHGRVAVPRKVVETIRADPANVDFGVHYGWNFDRQGKMRGYAINKVKPGSLAARYGLAPGDRILAVNGQAIDSIGRVGQLYRRYRNSSSVRVKIERGGQAREYIYYIQ